MRTIIGRNVNHLYVAGLVELCLNGQKSSSRGGDVVVSPWPVMSVYERPMERVLFDEKRDANPFFHLMESLWMLAGRDDAAFLNHYIKDFGTRFAEQGNHIHGAYGARWRYSMGYDQLDRVVARLKADPNDRQCVIQMWDARMEHVGGVPVGENDLSGTWLDRPCNTHVYLRVRETGRRQQAVLLDQGDMSDIVDRVLDLTVLCRSNDLVWGAYGANAVHFSVLQEYLAGRIGVRVGKMYQLSNNYHGYVKVLDGLGEPLDAVQDPYENAEVYAVGMGDNWEAWDRDLTSFMQWHDEIWEDTPDGELLSDIESKFKNLWFPHVACKVAVSYRLHRSGEHDDAMHAANVIAAPDWQRACVEWLERRAK